jgi:hypothetical protein
MRKAQALSSETSLADTMMMIMKISIERDESLDMKTKYFIATIKLRRRLKDILVDGVTGTATIM